MSTEQVTTETVAPTITIEAQASPVTAPTIPTNDTPTSTDAPAAPAAPAADDDGTVLGGKIEAPAADPAAPAAPAAEGGDADAPAGIPDKYELAMTGEDGTAIALDADALAIAEPVFRELGLSNENANKLMPVAKQFAESIQAQTETAVLQKFDDHFAEVKKNWREEYNASEFGGAKAEETERLAAAGLDALGFTKGHEFRELLTQSGFGNNVHMIAAMRKVGELVSEEGTFARSNSAGEKQIAGWSDRYDNTTEKKG